MWKGFQSYLHTHWENSLKRAFAIFEPTAAFLVVGLVALLDADGKTSIVKLDHAVNLQHQPPRHVRPAFTNSYGTLGHGNFHHLPKGEKPQRRDPRRGVEHLAGNHGLADRRYHGIHPFRCYREPEGKILPPYCAGGSEAFHPPQGSDGAPSLATGNRSCRTHPVARIANEGLPRPEPGSSPQRVPSAGS